MNRKLVIIGAVVLGIFFVLNVFSLFGRQEEVLRWIIYAAKEATEKEDIVKCMSFVSDAYRDKDGNNKAMLFRIVGQVFNRYNNIVVDLEKTDVALTDKTEAQADIVCFGQGARVDAASGSSLEVQKVAVVVLFRKESGRWKVRELRFTDPENFLRLLN